MPRTPDSLTSSFPPELLEAGRRAYAEQLDSLADAFRQVPELSSSFSDLISKGPEHFRHRISHYPDCIVEIVMMTIAATILAVGNRDSESHIN